MPQVVHDRWQKACLCCTEQEAHNVERNLALDPRGGNRDQPPGDCNASNPASHADPDHHEIARDLQKAIADEENTCAESVNGRTETKILIHFKRGECNVRAIKI